MVISQKDHYIRSTVRKFLPAGSKFHVALMNTAEKRAINPANFCARHPVLLAGRRAYQPLRNNKPPLRFTTSRCNLIRGSFERICSIDVRQEADRSRMSVSGRQAFETANNSFPRSRRDVKFHREIFSS